MSAALALHLQETAMSNKERFESLGLDVQSVRDLCLHAGPQSVLTATRQGSCVLYTVIGQVHGHPTEIIRVYNTETRCFDDVFGDENRLMDYL